MFLTILEIQQEGKLCITLWLYMQMLLVASTHCWFNLLFMEFADKKENIGCHPTCSWQKLTCSRKHSSRSLTNFNPLRYLFVVFCCWCALFHFELYTPCNTKQSLMSVFEWSRNLCVISNNIIHPDILMGKLFQQANALCLMVSSFSSSYCQTLFNSMLSGFSPPLGALNHSVLPSSLQAPYAHYSNKYIQSHWNFTAVSQWQHWVSTAAGCVFIQMAFGYLYQQAQGVTGSTPFLPRWGREQEGTVPFTVANNGLP